MHSVVAMFAHYYISSCMYCTDEVEEQEGEEGVSVDCAYLVTLSVRPAFVHTAVRYSNSFGH